MKFFWLIIPSVLYCLNRKVKDGLSSNDAKKTEIHTHSMKGASTYLGAVRVRFFSILIFVSCLILCSSQIKPKNLKWPLKRECSFNLTFYFL